MNEAQALKQHVRCEAHQEDIRPKEIAEFDRFPICVAHNLIRGRERSRQFAAKSFIFTYKVARQFEPGFRSERLA